MGKCRHLEDGIDDSEVARKRGHDRAESPPASEERSKYLRRREESIPADTQCVQPSSVELARSTSHGTSINGAIGSKASQEFLGDNTHSYHNSTSSSPSDCDADQRIGPTPCPYPSTSSAESITEGAELATGALGGQISECGAPLVPQNVSVNVADVSSGSGVDHSVQDSGVGDDQGDSSSAGKISMWDQGRFGMRWVVLLIPVTSASNPGHNPLLLVRQRCFLVIIPVYRTVFRTAAI